MKDNGAESIPSENIKVSVILPVWNPGPGIDRCIASLRGQSLREIEMIFVDDLGTDDSMTKVHAAAAADTRIRVIVNPENLGAGPSRNAGIEAARGDYLLFADPDDYIDLTFLEELYREALEKDLSLVKGSFVCETEDGTQVPRFDLNQKILTELAAGKPLFELLTYQHTSVLIARRILRDGNIRFGTSRCGEDTTFLLRLCSIEASFGICGTSGAYHYVQRTDSHMHRWNEQQLKWRLDGFKEKVDFLLSRKFDCNAEKYVLDSVRFLLRLHSYAVSFPELKNYSAEFLSSIREQALRCPLTAKAVNSDLKIRGLIVYGENLGRTPYKTYPGYPDGKEPLLIDKWWIRFLLSHPREIPAASVDCFRTVKNKLIKALIRE